MGAADFRLGAQFICRVKWGTYRGSFSGGRAELSGFTPGGIIWGRVRKIGTGGEVGGWSDPAQIRVG